MAGPRHKYGVLLPECATYGRQDNEPRDRYAIDARHVLPAGPPRSFCEKYLRRLSLFATPAHSLFWISCCNGMRPIQGTPFLGKREDSDFRSFSLVDLKTLIFFFFFEIFLNGDMEIFGEGVVK